MVVAATLIKDLVTLAEADRPSEEEADLSKLGIGSLTTRYRTLDGQYQAVGQKSLELAYSIGETLERVRMVVGKGRWLGWCENEDLEPRTAQRYIKFREKVGVRANLAELPADCSMRGAMALLTEVKQKAERTPTPVFPVATPADIVIEVLDAGKQHPDRIIRAIRRSRSEGVDLVLTSWPYCLNATDFGYVDFTSYDDWLAAAIAWANQLSLVMSPNGRAVVNLPIDVRKDQPEPRPIGFDGLRILRAAGFKYQGTILWAKSENGQTSNAKKRGSPKSPNAPTLATGDELLLVVHKGNWNQGRAGEANDLGDDGIIWSNAHWTIAGKTDKEYIHVLPDELVARIIRGLSFPGDLVADFHCGSGQVAVGALKHGRKFVGGDVNPYAVALSSRRVQEAWKAASGAQS
jgi:modification methylase